MTKTNKKRYPFKLATNRIMLTNLYAAKLNGEPVHVMKIDLKLTRMTDSDFLEDTLIYYMSLKEAVYDYIEDCTIIKEGHRSKAKNKELNKTFIKYLLNTEWDNDVIQKLGDAIYPIIDCVYDDYQDSMHKDVLYKITDGKFMQGFFHSKICHFSSILELKDAPIKSHFLEMKNNNLFDYYAGNRSSLPKEVSLVYTFRDRRHMDDSDDVFLPDGKYMRIFPLDNQKIIDENNEYFNTRFESKPNDRTFFEDFTDLEEIFYYNDLSMYTSTGSNILENMLTLVSYYEAGGVESGIAKKIRTVKLHVSKAEKSNGALLLDFHYTDKKKSFLRDEANKFIENAIKSAKERMDIDDSSYDTILEYTVTNRRPDLPVFEADKILNLCFKLKEVTGKNKNFTTDELIIKQMGWLNSENVEIPSDELLDIVVEILNMVNMFNDDNENHPYEGIVFDMNEYSRMETSLVPETILNDTSGIDMYRKIKVPCGFTLYRFDTEEDKECILPFLNNGWNIDYRREESIYNLHLLTYLKGNFEPSGGYTGLTRCKNVSRSKLSSLLNGKASEIFLSY